MLGLHALGELVFSSLIMAGAFQPSIRPLPLQSVTQTALRAAPSIVAVAVLTAFGYVLKLNLPTVSFLYLLVVVLQSLLGDFRSSATVSVICFLCLNYFFVQPLFSFSVSDASDTIALIAFLITGLVITRLTSRAQQAAISEKSQREATTRLYDLARELLALNPEAEISEALLHMLRSHFKLHAISFFDAD